MQTDPEQLRPAGAPGVLAVLVLVELILLRTATRTLIHIPGLGRFDTTIGILAEVGRLAYYLAVVFLAVSLAILASQGLRAGTARQVVGGAGALVFLGVAGAGRLGVLSGTVVGWSSLALLIVVTVTTWRGTRTVPIGCFVLGSVAAGLAVLGQESGGGLTGRQVDGLMLTAEISLILAAITAPLLLKYRPGKPAVVAGLGAAVLGVVAFMAGSSTLSILVLWNLGVPGWLPGMGYALALASLVTTLWSSMASDQRLTAVGLVLLVAGGIGATSTYQTGLVVAGVLLLGQSMRQERFSNDRHRTVGARGDTETRVPAPSS